MQKISKLDFPGRARRLAMRCSVVSFGVSLGLVLMLSACSGQKREALPRMIVADYARTYAKAMPDGLKLPSEALAGKELFMVGESHCISANDRIKFDLVRQLSKEAHLRYLVLEENILFAALLDYCVFTGDGRFLERLLSIMIEDYDWADTKRFWRELLAWNMALPSEKRVRVHGFELAGFPVSYPLLSELLGPVPVGTGFDWLVSDLASASKPDADPYEIYKALLVFGLKCISDDGSLVALFGSAGPFIVAAGALDARMRHQSFEDHANPEYSVVLAEARRNLHRDLALYRGVRGLLNQADGSVLVWYGTAHITSNFGMQLDGVSRLEPKAMPWFGERVKAEPELAKRSLVLGLIYFDCLSYYEKLSGNSDKPELQSDKTIFGRRLAEVPTGNLALLDLKLPGSPFADHSFGVKTWSDYADYIVMVRGSGKPEEFFKP